MWASGVLILVSQGHPNRLISLCTGFAAALLYLPKKEQQLNLIISLFCVLIPALATWHLFAWWAFTCKVNKVSACQKQLFSFEIYFPMESLKIFKLLMRALKLGLKYIIRRNITAWRIAMIHILATSRLLEEGRKHKCMDVRVCTRTRAWKRECTHVYVFMSTKPKIYSSFFDLLIFL